MIGREPEKTSFGSRIQPYTVKKPGNSETTSSRKPVSAYCAFQQSVEKFLDPRNGNKSQTEGRSQEPVDQTTQSVESSQRSALRVQIDAPLKKIMNKLRLRRMVNTFGTTTSYKHTAIPGQSNNYPMIWECSPGLVELLLLLRQRVQGQKKSDEQLSGEMVSSTHLSSKIENYSPRNHFAVHRGL